MSDWLAAFHFIRPEWLWLMVPAALLYLVVLRREDVSRRWTQIIAPELLKELLVGHRRRWRFRPVHSVCFAIAIAAVAMAGPSWTREHPPFTEDKAPLAIALDISRDMDAIDVQPTRLERAKLKIHDLMKIRAGSRTALFVYGTSAHMVLPLAADESLMDMYVQWLSSSLLKAGPKDTAAALRKIQTFMKNETVPGTILFITSGIERKAFAAFAGNDQDSRDQVVVLGVGTEAGGPLRSDSGQFVSQDGRRVFSKLDVEGLRTLKREADIPVSTMTLDDDDLKWVQRRALSHLQAVQQHGAQVRWVDEGYWLVIPIAVLTALWFRKGWTIRWGAAGLTFLFLWSIPAKAGNLRFIDLWLTPDQQGRYYYEHGDYAAAAERFTDPMWKGLALCRKKDYQAALDAFALLDTPESWFNQGNALAYLKKYPEAVQAYTEALQRRPHWREAEENLALVRSVIPPPKKPEEQEEAPNLKPDKITFDEKGKRGKKTRLNFGPEQMADIWMRNIQTSPADFLRRKFAIEGAQAKHK
jgi:Ca-activated chloride channel homolog